MAWTAVGSKAVVLLSLIHRLLLLTLFVGFCVWSLFYYSVLCVFLHVFFFAIIMMGKRKQVAFLWLSSRCLVTVSVLCLACSVPDHILFFTYAMNDIDFCCFTTKN